MNNVELYPRDWLICRPRYGGGFIVVSPKEVFDFQHQFTVDQTVGNYLTNKRKNDYRTGDLVFTKWYRSYVVHHSDEKYVYCISRRKQVIHPILKRKITRHVVNLCDTKCKLVDWDNATTEQAWDIISKLSRV